MTFLREEKSISDKMRGLSDEMHKRITKLFRCNFSISLASILLDRCIEKVICFVNKSGQNVKEDLWQSC